MQSGEDWVIMNSVRYKDKYSKILRRLCAYRKEQHEYDTILELTDNAIEIYPFDEWQSLKIDALMGMNRYKKHISCTMRLQKCSLKNWESHHPSA